MASKEVVVNAASGSYSVKIGYAILQNVLQYIEECNQRFVKPKKIVLITDTSVYQIYKNKIEKLIEDLKKNDRSELIVVPILPWDIPISIDARDATPFLPSAVINKNNNIVIVVPDGEISKSQDIKSKIEKICVHYECDKTTIFVAFGGGVVGDLTGFVASTFYRGCRFLQIPTTLLAMVDSSIGGKTAINILPNGKNLIGSYHQPLLVVVDIEFCETLTSRLLADGIAEIIKSGLTSMKDVFESCERLAMEFKKTGVLGREDLLYLIYKSIEFKAHVVMSDERDMGLRNILNFGHTIGHAIEAQSTNQWLHGECVSVGIVYELMAIRSLGLCGDNLPARAETCLCNYGLPTRLHPPDINVDAVMNSMRLDKKNTDGDIRIVAVTKIGHVAPNMTMMQVPSRLMRRLLSPCVSLINPSGSPSSTTSIRQINGVARLPGSKSIANRALLLTALGQGTCRLQNLPTSEDVGIMKKIIKEVLGVTVEDVETGEVSIMGLGWRSRQNPSLSSIFKSNGTLSVWVENAGTVTRFLPCVFGYLLSISRPDQERRQFESVVMDGNQHMRHRPIGDLIEAMTSSFTGIDIKYLKRDGCLPISISQRKGIDRIRFPGGQIEVSNATSSQFVSALLMISPLADTPVHLKLRDSTTKHHTIEVVSQPYIDMTINLMKLWGVEVEVLAPDFYRIPCGGYTNPAIYQIEDDASAASYPLALAALTGGSVSVRVPVPTDDPKPLQGDTFFIRVLMSMGCTVEANCPKGGFTKVTGPPNGVLKPIDINMNEVTDTFMTTSVLMARAAECVQLGLIKSDGAENVPTVISRIRGVANQRLKECNRIEATVNNLSRLGYQVEELFDGLRIHPGVPHYNPVIIDPHSDHRLAMSFGVLNAIRPHIVVPEWRCVEKTFPTFWDMCENDLGLTIEGRQLPSNLDVSFDSSSVPTMWLIGMRNVGKTTLGQAAARMLDWDFIDLDETIGFEINEFIENNGWPAFRQKEAEHLMDTAMRLGIKDDKYVSKKISTRRGPVIIACGGGVIESSAAVSFLQSQPHVIWIKLNENDVIQLNDENQQTDMSHKKPLYLKSFVDTYKERRSRYSEASKFEYITPVAKTLHQVVDGFCKLIKSILRPLLPPMPNTKMLCLTRSTYRDANIIITPKILKDIDFLEVRVDLLENVDTFEEEIFYIRSVTDKPLVLTLRSIDEGGNWNSKQISHLTVEDFVRRSQKIAPAMIDVEYVEICRCPRLQLLLSTSHCPSIIVSRHFPKTVVPEDDFVIRLCLRQMSKFCRTSNDLIKIVFSPSDIPDDTSDSYRLAAICRSESQALHLPIIGLLLTHKGATSRFFIHSLAPVTHPSLLPAAPGQLTAAEINKGRLFLRLPCHRYYLFGFPIEKSPSTILHNTIFEAIGSFSSVYSKFSTTQLSEVTEIVGLSSFTGASITIPLKEKVMEYVIKRADIFEVDGAVSEIKAVNTIAKNTLTGKLFCTNTDYLAILRGLHMALHQEHDNGTIAPRDGMVNGTTVMKRKAHNNVLIIGAGGTARAAIYAAKQIQTEIQIYIWNRTANRAEALAKEYGLCHFTNDSAPISFIAIIGAIPGDAVPITSQRPDLLQKMASTSTPPLIIEMAYTPRHTPLVQKGLEYGCKIITGVELLIWQGMEQAKLWSRLSGSTENHNWSDIEKMVTPLVEDHYRITQSIVSNT